MVHFPDLNFVEDWGNLLLFFCPFSILPEGTAAFIIGKNILDMP